MAIRKRKKALIAKHSCRGIISALGRLVTPDLSRCQVAEMSHLKLFIASYSMTGRTGLFDDLLALGVILRDEAAPIA